MQENTSMNMNPRLEAALAWIFPLNLIWLFVEKENVFVRKHACQSLALTVAGIVLSIICIGPLVSTVFMIIGIIKAAKGEEFMLPWIGEKAEEICMKIGSK